jgi:anaerobic magnesium-protoporphyrin IX monomethyl ester cyclase
MARVFLVKCSQYEGLITNVTFPLGIMVLASVLRQASDRHEIAIYDMRIRQEDITDLKDAVTRFRPDIVGLSALTFEARNMHRAAWAVRETGFEGPIVGGGPFATSFPEDALACEAIDMLVLGEGEETFRELVDALEKKRDPATVAGIAYRENGHVRRTPARPYIKNLDALPFPAYDLVEMEEYYKYMSFSIMRTGKFMNVFSSRACPYRCVYCHSMFGKGFRARSPENVLKEVRHVVDTYGITYFEFVDDIFNWNLPRAKKIFDLLSAEGLRLKVCFPNGLRCDRLDREFLEKLSRFDFSQMCVAVETASPRLQKLIRKNLDLEKVTEVINICNDLRIYTRGYFMLGFPTETEEEMRMTVDFGVRSKLHSAIYFIAIPFRGTELYDLCMKYSKVKPGFAHDDLNYFVSPVNFSDAPDEVLFEIQKWAYPRALMSPARICRILRDFPEWGLLWFGLKRQFKLFRIAGKGMGPLRREEVPQFPAENGRKAVRM